MREMKDSGIEWIGRIPRSWGIIRNKYLFTVSSGDALDKSSLVDGGEFPVYGGGEVIGYYNHYNVEKGTTLIGRVGARCGCITTVNQPSWATDNALVIRQHINSYIMYSLISANLNRLNTSNAQPLITGNKILNSYIPYPSIDEQYKIGSFLDSKCAAIDALATDVQAEIDVLERYKQSIIAEVVTKGLNKSVTMRDSGIGWIGQIPEHWSVLAAKYVVAISNGSDPISNEGNTPVYGSGTRSFRTCVEYKEGPTVLLGRKGTIDIPQWIEGRYWNVDTAFDTKIKCAGYALKFYYYLATCFDYKSYVTQTALPSMTQKQYLNMRILCPPLLEQCQIIDFLDVKCSRIDSIIATKQEQLSVLDSYKKSIIYEYVTGKKEVPAP